MSMDEVAVTNPIDLVSMLSDSSGRGILIEPVCHSLAQLKRRYGEHQADDIWWPVRYQGLAGRDLR